jgi:hypothetical protein
VDEKSLEAPTRFGSIKFENADNVLEAEAKFEARRVLIREQSKNSLSTRSI